MQGKKRGLLELALAAAGLAALGLVLRTTTEAKTTLKVIEFDVAEDGSRFVFDQDVVHEDGLPAYGGYFVTQGYLYPAGTLTCVDGECNGTNADGSPEFPEKVVGTWTCYGTHIGDGAHTATGPWVITTQMFDFGAAPGDVSLVTNGIELSDLDVPFRRAVIGATGLRGAVEKGEQTQTLLGFGPSLGIALRVAFTTKP